MVKYLKAIIEPHQVDVIESILGDFGVDKNLVQKKLFNSDRGPRLCLDFQIDANHILDTLDAIARISRSTLGKVFVLDNPQQVFLDSSIK